jgi:hypothetical protein
MSEDQDLTQADIDNLKIRADRLGVKYHPSIGADKLREKIAEALSSAPAPSEQAAPPPPSPAPASDAVEPEVETLGMKRKRLKEEASKLIRISITCMNPAKREWDGEIITTGNALVGTIRNYVPFNAENGWHVPYMLYLQLRDRQCQVFHTEKTKHGVSRRVGKLIREFAIEVLPPLTEEELKDLAQRQALAGSVG